MKYLHRWIGDHPAFPWLVLQERWWVQVCIPTTVKSLHHGGVWLCIVQSRWANSSLWGLSVYLFALHMWVCVCMHAFPSFISLLRCHDSSLHSALVAITGFWPQSQKVAKKTPNNQPKTQRNTLLPMKFQKHCACPNSAGRCGSSMPAEQWAISFKSWSMYIFF